MHQYHYFHSSLSVNTGIHPSVKMTSAQNDRFRTRVSDALAAEDKTLRAYDFPLNIMKNGGIRPIVLPGGKRVQDYPVIHEDLGLYAASKLQSLLFEGEKVAY